jgi:hypothetical protein
MSRAASVSMPTVKLFHGSLHEHLWRFAMLFFDCCSKRRSFSIYPDTHDQRSPLAYLMEQCQSLKALNWMLLEMDENLPPCLAPIPDLEINFAVNLQVLEQCFVAEVLGRNQARPDLNIVVLTICSLADGCAETVV